jgi:diguanylate cyclase (GGDEF)-like protein
MRLFKGIFSGDKALGIASIIVSIGVLGATAWLVYHSAGRLLQADTEADAVAWASKIQQNAFDLDGILSGNPPSETDLTFLRSAKDLGNVAQLTIYDGAGREVLASNRLGEFVFDAGTIADGTTPVSLALDGEVFSQSAQGALSNLQGYYTQAFVPIFGDAGEVRGVLGVIVDNSAKRTLYLKWLSGMLAALFLLVGLGLIVPGSGVWFRLREKWEAEESADFLVSHDPLTEISNRSHFLEQLAQTLDEHVAEGRQMALHYIDVDRFKEINDSFGLEAGDKFLQDITEKLLTLVDEPDQIARIGSDEFAIIQADTSGAKHAEIFGSRIVDTLSGAYDVVGNEVISSASVGIAVAPDHGTDALRLLKSADLALHQIKGQGRGKKCVYRPGMDQSMQSRLELQSILRKAFDNNWFELHYQPQYDLSARRLTGFEALLRLKHPERGMIPPVEFIPVAEETGLIQPIGEWIVREACVTAAAWPEQLSLAINLSPAQLRESKLAETVDKIMSQTGIKPGRLEVEITEGLLMDASDLTMTELDHLKELGIALVMDDFGTGYSSLSYLWRFAFDKIKIDKSFVHNLGAGRNVESLLKSIINIGQSLDLRVIAEGVEKPEQAHFLMTNSCHHVQGFLFGRPVPKAEVAPIIMKDVKNAAISHNGIDIDDIGADQPIGGGAAALA